MRGIRRAEGVEYTVLVPNVKGCERALACEVDEINGDVGQRHPRPCQPAHDA